VTVRRFKAVPCLWPAALADASLGPLSLQGAAIKKTVEKNIKLGLFKNMLFYSVTQVIFVRPVELGESPKCAFQINGRTTGSKKILRWGETQNRARSLKNTLQKHSSTVRRLDYWSTVCLQLIKLYQSRHMRPASGSSGTCHYIIRSFTQRVYDGLNRSRARDRAASC